MSLKAMRTFRLPLLGKLMMMTLDQRVLDLLSFALPIRMPMRLMSICGPLCGQRSRYLLKNFMLAYITFHFDFNSQPDCLHPFRDQLGGYGTMWREHWHWYPEI